MFRGRGGPIGDLSRINADRETRLRRLETIEKGVIPFQFQALPLLRGFWPMSSVDENGAAYDLSEQDRVLTLNGNPTYDYGSGIAPFLEMDGTGDYLSRADEPGLDISGTETFVESTVRGLTIGGWFFISRLGIEEALIGKWNENGVNQRSYLLQKDVGDSILMNISSTGANADGLGLGIFSINNWNFIVGVFDPSNSQIRTYVNGFSETLGTAFASLFNSNAQFNIGARDNGATDHFQGSASHCFLCATALSLKFIDSLYIQSRPLFNV